MVSDPEWWFLDLRVVSDPLAVFFFFGGGRVPLFSRGWVRLQVCCFF